MDKIDQYPGQLCADIGRFSAVDCETTHQPDSACEIVWQGMRTSYRRRRCSATNALRHEFGMP
jgi:hypothetical protein